MATFQWSYPYNDTDTHTCFFSGSPADATYQWRPPYTDAPAPRQTRVQTQDGGIRVYNLGTAPRLFTLTWSTLQEGSASTETEYRGYLGIKAFLAVTGWGEETFGYYDHAGTSEIEVRYVSGIESFRRVGGGRYEGTITLREEL